MNLTKSNDWSNNHYSERILPGAHIEFFHLHPLGMCFDTAYSLRLLKPTTQSRQPRPFQGHVIGLAF